MTGHVIHLNTSIHASLETVWSVLTDLPHTHEILRSVKSSEVLTEGEYGVGTTWRESRNLFGHHGEEELHVTESDKPRRTIHETKLGHDKVRTAYSIQKNPDGSTKLLLTATVDQKERSAAENLMWAVWGGISFESTRKMLQHDLEDIAKEAARREGGGSSESQPADQEAHPAS